MIETQQLGAVLEALHEARSAAGMVVPRKAYRVGPTHAKALLGRLRELVQDEEPYPAELLCAVVRAKVHQHAKSENVSHREGAYANGASICRASWWAGNLDAGRAWLKRGGPPEEAAPKGRQIMPHSPYVEKML